MTFAWCVLWSSRWMSYRVEFMMPNTLMGRVMLAMVLSGLSCLAVFGLDTLDDMLKDRGGGDVAASQAAAQAIQTIINSLGILVGFSWEFCFDGGVAAVASTTSYPATCKFCMGLLIAVAMTPMWQHHILTKEMALQKLKHDRDHYMRLEKAKATPRDSLIKDTDHP